MMKKSAAKGTIPEGTRNEAEASAYVRDMFGRVAPKYDLLNHLLSFQLDRYWRWKTVRALKSVLQRSDSVTLDLCCGTGDLLAGLAAESKGQVIGCDFSHGMLLGSRQKTAAPLLEADGLRLPFADGSFDLITIAFGFRNFSNYRVGLSEAFRLLKPGGRLAILEFSQPPNLLIRWGNEFYSGRLVPWLGGLISGGARDAYRYLPRSVSKFPDAPELAQWMEETGFTSEFRLFSGGVVALHLGDRL
jgi:demethylmenaquinone methyltransferase / 2-methoxy-6-polyprenyl-1,4-benzoquinol methylase